MKREIQLENMKGPDYYDIIDLSNTESDENKLWFSLIAAFRVLSCNGHAGLDDPAYEHDLDVYITYDSIRQNYPKMFNNHIDQNDSFALRLYNLLSGGLRMKRLYLPQFLLAVRPIVYGDQLDKNYFAFRLYDGDNDGIISTTDLTDILKNMLKKCPYRGPEELKTKSCSCILFKEVSRLYEMSLKLDILIE